MQEGWFKFWRKSMLTSFYKDSYALHLATHLIGKANIRERKALFNGEEITIRRGELIAGRKQLAYETGIKESTIYRKLKLFEKVGFCNIRSNNRYSLISINNYSKYQDNENSTSNNQRTTSEQPADTLEEVKKLRSKENTNGSVFSTKQLEENFNKVWDRYPRREGRKDAFRHFVASVKSDVDWLNIKIALENYKVSETVKKGFVKQGSTWFNNWQDWVVMPTSENEFNRREG